MSAQCDGGGGGCLDAVCFRSRLSTFRPRVGRVLVILLWAGRSSGFAKLLFVRVHRGEISPSATVQQEARQKTPAESAPATRSRAAAVVVVSAGLGRLGRNLRLHLMRRHVPATCTPVPCH